MYQTFSLLLLLLLLSQLLVFVTVVTSQQTSTPPLSTSAPPSDDTPSICLSLRQSIACPAFHQFYVSTGVVDRYPFLPSNITTVHELDDSLLNYVNSTSDYLLPLGCLSTNYSPKPPYARYALTKMCARLIQDAEDSLPCNTEHNVVPPPLCQSTCLDWVNSITAITAQTQVCSDSPQRTAALANYTSHCLSWQGYNATAGQNCISGFANEPENCGFRDNVQEACEFCQSTANVPNCCQMVHCDKSGNGGTLQGFGVATIIGIVFGALATLVLILLAGYCFSRSRRRRSSNKNNPPPFPPSTSSSSSYLSDSKTAIQDHHHQLQQPPSPQQEQQQQQGKHWMDNSKTPTVSLLKNTSATSLPSPISLQDDHHLQYSSSSPPPPQQQQEEFYRVIHAYPPQMEDELAMGVGDVILLAFPFDDGWALGVNTTTGLKGAFPMICVARIEPSVFNSTESTMVTSSIPKRMASKSSSKPDLRSPFMDHPPSS
ncbi:hypothetical protein BC941DRAFT_474276 [Chlamydoabsidia padenii]|nr:hypothetical protein BC941DRAFT_474276 [Chlamydoabsidia padenii]